MFTDRLAYKVVSFLGAVIVILMVNRLAALFSASESTWPIPLGVGLLTLLALAMPLKYNWDSWACPVLIEAGIPVGIFIDVAWTSALNTSDRNLFPVEIVMWLVVSILPVLLGFIVGRLILRKNL